VSGGFDRFGQRCGRHLAGPQPELAALDHFAADNRLDLEDDPPRRGRSLQFLPARNTCRPSQIARQDDPIRGVKLNNRCHAITVARLWRDRKLKPENGGNAKQLLTDTGLSVSKVAELSGFKDLSRFNASFRQQTGMPPTGYRKREQR
jgi:hypothetical protein